MTCYNYLSLSSLKNKETSSENGMYSNKLTKLQTGLPFPLPGKKQKEQRCRIAKYFPL